MIEPTANSRRIMIRLDQFLKLTGLFETGGQAKLAIQGGEVIVNGEIETRRRKQLHAGDVVCCFDEEFEVTLDEEPETEQPPEQASDQEEE